ncbi:MAG TPA: PAS domain S-box protein, partial [Burkholderiales bacterium]|nr:PAS domain S-box protein [Burkholderiales bacterium]
RLLDARQPFHDLLLRRRAANGELSYVSVDGRPIFDASGTFTGYRGVAKDVTMRIAAELALRESEARFRGLAGLSSDLYWEQDTEFRFTAVSGIGPRVDSGRVQMVGKRRWERQYFNMTEADWAAHRADLEARRPFRDLELGRITEDGAVSWVTVSGEPKYDDTGHFTGYRGVGKDITARKREEAVLALEHAVTLCLAEATTAAAGLEAVLRTMCESQGWPVGRYFAADEDAGVLRFSQAWGKPLPGADEYIARSRTLVYRRGEGLSGAVWQSGEPLWVKDVSKDTRASRSSQGALHGGAFVFPLTTGGRTIGVMSFSSADVRDPDARLLKAVGVIGSQVGQFLMRKKAERKEQRRSQDLQRFRAAMDMAHDAIYLTDRTTMRFLDANRVGCKALGYTREQLLAMGPHDVLTKSREELEREFDEVIARGTEGIRTEAAYARRDGRPGWSELFRRALRSGEGWIIVTISRDITKRKAEEGRLRRFRAALDAAAEPVLLVDARTGAYIDFNEAACRTFGYSREELLKLTVGDIRIDRPRERILQDYKRLEAEPGGGDDMEISACRRKDGSVFPVEFTRRLVETSEGPIVVASARDLTERLRADQRQAQVLKYQERIARFGQLALAQRQPAELIERAVQAVLEALSAEAVAYFEPEPGAAALVSRALVGVADATAQPATVPCPPGSPVMEAMHSGSRAVVDGARLPFPWAKGLRSTALLPVRGESGVRGLLCAAYKMQNAFAAEELNFAEAVASVLSTALQRIDSENRLAYLAQFDPLTGLANRTLLADRFSQIIVQAKRRDVPLATLFIDLDGFKTVNDTLGHAGGDELLKEVALRLQQTVRDGDTVARISGDEFAIVLA